jgi:hypothetical protein
MYVALFTLAFVGDSHFLAVGNHIVSNQLIAGSIMVRHMILILVFSFDFRVYYLMRCTHNALWVVIMNNFDSTISYFGLFLFLARSARFDITGWYVNTFSVLNRLCCLLET